MSDKLNTLNHYDDGAEFHVFARVIQGEKKEDKNGDPYWSIKVKDDTGTAWLKAFKAHNLDVRGGEVLKVKAKVNIWKGKRGLQCWGDDVKVVEGAPEPDYAPAASRSPATGSTPAPRLTDKKLVAAMAEWAETLKSVLPPEAVAAAIGGIVVGLREGTVELAAGEDAREPGDDEPGWGGPEGEDPAARGFDDDDVPFGFFWVPFLGALLWSVGQHA